MELKTAIEILDYHQEWRLGKREDMIHEPKKLTEALDIVLSEVKKLLIYNVSNITYNYDSMKEQTNGKVAIRKGCQNFCTGVYQEIIGWRDKLPNEY